tara:strand:- start:1384 stop:2526 length:1143 start_codon:yes stop_codon:yes gene_type:complete
MKKIYLDNHSTTQIDPKVLKAMLPYFNEKYGNSSSRSHAFGWEAEAAIEIARNEVSSLIGAEDDEIIFTSGATESNNLAIRGLFNSNVNLKKKIITLATEHRAVLDVCKKIDKKFNKTTTYILPNSSGIIDLSKFEQLLTKDVLMTSIMHVNNEIGVIQPIKEIGEICKKNNILFHVDAAQSLGKININVKEMNIDLLSISGHKLYGPKGIGALYINNSKNIILDSLIVGGGQELNIRSGTLPVPLIVGFGSACTIAKSLMQKESQKILELRELLINNILAKYPNTIINGHREKRVSGNINMSFPFLNGKSIINSLPEIAVSSGSACTSSDPRPSHVLTALGLNKLDINTTIRIGIGRFNSKEDIEIASNQILNAIKLKL